MNIIKKISFLLVTLLITLQSPISILASSKNDLDPRLQALIAREERSTRSTNNDYFVGFSLETIYRPNQLIHSNFNFKVSVSNNRATIAPDGSYGDHNYGWADDFSIAIYDANGQRKFLTHLSWFGDVYQDVQSLTRLLSQVHIQVGDSIALGNTYYPPGTIKWYGNDSKYYKSNRSELTYQNNLQKYLITNEGLVKQPSNVTIKPNNLFSGYMKLNVRNTQSGTIEERRIDYRTVYDSYTKKYNLRVSTDQFGTKENMVWAEEYKILQYSSSGVHAGVIFEAGDGVSGDLESLVGKFQLHSGFRDFNDRLILSGQSNNSIKLFDNNSTLPSIFTNTNQNFNTGFGKPEVIFYISPQGLMQK